MTNKDKEVQQISPLDAVGKETLVALVTSSTIPEAAEKLGISERMVYKRKNKYGLQEVIDSIPEQAYDTLKLGAAKAASVMVNKLEDRRQGFDASKEILDRVGLTKKEGPKVAQQFNVNGEEMKVEFIEKK
ncbi:helix-turn-helix domain containing protein [Candidatus Micrarchaeota archaeon]|jgi:hypothetical protein|nr:helix-turn-helix domain containing protein [Candidatus Micrarchaeota archaeon]